ncbi:aldo/keto reductase [bacterium]|nr:aldo/keto reductase [bacterium]
MELRRLGDSTLNVSVIGLGTWVMGGVWWAEPDDMQSIEAIKVSLENGVNLIDTAPAYGYGRAERLVGQAIKGMRDKVVIATKCGLVWDEKGNISNNLKRDSLLREIDASLERLGVDVIDLYQVHWPDPNTPIKETFETLEEIRQSGKIRYIGVSNFSVEQMEEARKYAKIVSNQPPYSMFNRGIEKEILPYCRENNIGILAYSPMERGILTGKFHLDGVEPPDDLRRNHFTLSPEAFEPTKRCLSRLRQLAEEKGCTLGALAIAWVIHQDGIKSALVGARNAQQARQNIMAAEVALSKNDLERIEEILEDWQKELNRAK